MTDTPAPSECQPPAARFVALIGELRHLLFYRISRTPIPPPGRLAPPVATRLNRWLGWHIRRLPKLLEAPPRPAWEAAPPKPAAAPRAAAPGAITPEATTPGAITPGAITPGAPGNPPAKPRVRFPMRRGWLLTFAPETRHIPSNLAFMFYKPEVAALIAERPEVARMLRRLFHILTTQTPPPCIAAPPRKPRARKPRPPKPPRVKRLRFSRRADLLLLMRGGREHPGGDNPKYGVPHWGIPKRKRGAKG